VTRALLFVCQNQEDETGGSYGEGKCLPSFCGETEQRNHLEELGLDGRTILK
jgi:hypothetical protein